MATLRSCGGVGHGHLYHKPQPGLDLGGRWGSQCVGHQRRRRWAPLFTIPRSTRTVTEMGKGSRERPGARWCRTSPTTRCACLHGSCMEGLLSLEHMFSGDRDGLELAFFFCCYGTCIRSQPEHSDIAASILLRRR